jgi:hypothetical protein
LLEELTTLANTGIYDFDEDLVLARHGDRIVVIKDDRPALFRHNCRCLRLGDVDLRHVEGKLGGWMILDERQYSVVYEDEVWAVQGDLYNI